VEPLSAEPELAERVSPDRPTTRASIRWAARREMALKLGDVVFRRTGLGTLGHPGRSALEISAGILGREHDWSRSRIEREVDEVEAMFRRTA